MAVYGALNISKTEKDARAVAAREALAITRLEGSEPGQLVLATYEQYIAGNIDWETCEKQVKAAAIKELRSQSLIQIR